MDEYFCYRYAKEDFNEISRILKKDNIVTFPYSADNLTAFVITIAGPIKPYGLIPWGGSVMGHYLVALRQRGAEYFDLQNNRMLNDGYISEKLNIGLSDAKVIADLLHEIQARLKH